MNSACLEARPWPRGRWWGVVALIFAAQLGLIFWLADTAPATRRAAAPSPALQLVGKGHAELLALEDPTLFALPHAQGFSGLAWLAAPKPPASFFGWSESPRWLSLAMPQFGTLFNRPLETNELIAPQNFTRPEPELTAPAVLTRAETTEQSVLRLEGGVAARRLLTPIVLPLQTNTEILTNSDVQVVIDAAGRVVSVPVLLSRSGNPEVDKEALRQALAARFEPVSVSGPARTNAADSAGQLTWGRMIFEWRTMLVPATNVPGGP
jgi:TonB family protein